MSKTSAPVSTVLEWSPTGVRVWKSGRSHAAEYATLAEADASESLRGGGLGVAIGRRHVFLRCLNLPNTSKEEASNVLRVQLEQAFPLPASELSYDFTFVGEAGSEGRPAAVGAMKAELLRQLRGELGRLGIKPQWIAPASWASQLIAAKAGLTDALLMEPTEEGLAIDVIQKGALTGSRVAGTRSASIDVAAEAARTEAAYKLSSPALILAGGLDASGAGERRKESTLAAFADAQVDFHFELPETAAKLAAKKINDRRFMAVLFALSALVIGTLFWVERSEHGDKVSEIQKKFERQKKSIESSKTLFTSSYSKVETGTQTLAQAFDAGQPASDLVSVATNLLPPKAWLSGFQFERGKRLTLKGTALNGAAVSQYVDSLASQSRFRDVQLVYANNTKLEETPVVQFSVSLHVVGNLPFVEKAKAKKKR